MAISIKCSMEPFVHTTWENGFYPHHPHPFAFRLGVEVRHEHLDLFNLRRLSTRKTLRGKTCMSCMNESKGAKHAEFLELCEDVAEHRLLLSKILAERKSAVIEPDMLARLIRLCHPDRHGGSEASITAIQWLLAQSKART